MKKLYYLFAVLIPFILLAVFFGIANLEIGLSIFIVLYFVSFFSMHPYLLQPFLFLHQFLKFFITFFDAVKISH